MRCGAVRISAARRAGRRALRSGKAGGDEDSFARRYLWLRELGLLREELTMVDFGISDAERDWLTERGVTVCAPEKLAERMGERTT